MEVICIQGVVPGPIVATLSHRAQIRQVNMSVARHPSGGWRIAQADGGFGPRCHAVATAILLEGSEAFADEAVQAQAA